MRQNSSQAPRAGECTRWCGVRSAPVAERGGMSAYVDSCPERSAYAARWPSSTRYACRRKLSLRLVLHVDETCVIVSRGDNAQAAVPRP